MESPIICLFCTIFVLLLSFSLVSNAESPTSSSPDLNKECALLNTSCDTCVSNAKCFYCNTNKKCAPYPSGKIFPGPSDCAPDMGAARWGTCAVNFKILLIAMGVLAGFILIVLPCTIYCCCCRNGGSANAAARHQREEDKWAREEAERKERSSERRAQREEMYSEIRAKYGLNKDSQPPYKRMADA